MSVSISRDITSAPFINTVAEFLITLMSISIGLYHSLIKYDANFSPITNVKNPDSTYNPSVDPIGPNILNGSLVFELIFIQNSTVYSLYCPALFKKPFPGKIKEGSLLFGNKFVLPVAP